MPDPARPAPTLTLHPPDPAARLARLVAGAFEAGDEYVLSLDDDGWTLFDFMVDNTQLSLWVAPDVIDEAYAAARTAARTGRCGTCELTWVVHDAQLEVRHQSGCVAASAARESSR